SQPTPFSSLLTQGRNRNRNRYRSRSSEYDYSEYEYEYEVRMYSQTSRAFVCAGRTQILQG
ncbi:hypothetical protein JXA88_07890, partial [Candidatus Fermentibacteria bacterium]|nr:hypothetical protein [Candidatus Fermentibacteria bacterium]